MFCVRGCQIWSFSPAQGKPSYCGAAAHIMAIVLATAQQDPSTRLPAPLQGRGSCAVRSMYAVPERRTLHWRLSGARCSDVSGNAAAWKCGGGLRRAGGRCR